MGQFHVNLDENIFYNIVDIECEWKLCTTVPIAHLT